MVFLYRLKRFIQGICIHINDRGGNSMEITGLIAAPHTLMEENTAVFKAGQRSPKDGWQYVKYLAPAE